MSRMVIPINFTDEDDYEYVKNKPNASYYIRELVRKDRENQQNDRDYIDKKIEELKKELQNQTVNTGSVNKSDDNLKNNIKNLFDMYD